MIKRQACFACTTPYQVMGAIGITQSGKLDADLYIFGMFPGYETVAEKLGQYSLFANVYGVDCKEFRSPGRKKAFKQMIFARKTVSAFLPEDVCYDSFYSTSRAHIKTILQNVLLKRNRDMETIIFEDGMGTYFSGSHILKTTELKGYAEKLLGWHLFDPDHTRIMANVPELVDVPDELSNCIVEKQPHIAWDQTTRDMLRKVFQVNPEDEIDSHCIIFDTLRGISHLNREYLSILDRCYEIIAEKGGYENTICKPHPRSTEITKANVKLYGRQGIPMEILYTGMADLEDRILVAFTSTAVFTPKILFGKEPVVICLHRCLKGARGSMEFEGTYEKFKSIYSDPERVYAPSTLDELALIMKKRMTTKD